MSDESAKILHLPEVDSTNTFARKNFSALDDATLVTADFQTAGRGRLGRKWVSPPGSSLLASFVMKNAADPFLATCTSSLAILDVLRTEAPEHRFYVKWPNDVYCGDAKIAGILCEGVLEGGKITGIIAGMGINVNLPEEEISRIDQRAASLEVLLKKKTDVKKMETALAKSLMRCYIIYSRFPDRLFEQWKSENALIGRVLDFLQPDGSVIRGEFRSVLRDGSAEVVTDNGSTVIFRCGDVRISKETLYPPEK